MELESVLKRLEELREELNDQAGPLVKKHQNFVIDYIKVDFEELYGTVVCCGNEMFIPNTPLKLVE